MRKYKFVLWERFVSYNDSNIIVMYCFIIKQSSELKVDDTVGSFSFSKDENNIKFILFDLLRNVCVVRVSTFHWLRKHICL